MKYNDSSTIKSVSIILGYYNGNKYLKEQIQSILRQSHQNFDIFISDDHSSVAPDMNILGLTTEEAKKVHITTQANNLGFCKNFLITLAKVDKPSDYFAFSDQDDLWHPDKIENALKLLSQHPEDKPAVYCSRTNISDETGHTVLGMSPLFKKTPSFSNALVQSIAGGNTMVFNRAARDIIVRSTTNTQVVSHDWWCYQIITGTGGVVLYDTNPSLNYRQHQENLVGSNDSWFARLTRVRYLWEGKLRTWNDINLTALVKNRDQLTLDNQHLLDLFITMRQSSLCKRLYLMKRARLYRQTILGNIGLLVAIFFNKV